MRATIDESEASRVYTPWRARLSDVGVRWFEKAMPLYRPQKTSTIEIEPSPTSVSVVKLEPSLGSYWEVLAKLRSSLKEIEIGEIHSFDGLIDLLYTLEEEPERDIELCVVKMFKEVNEVLFIYVDEYMERQRFLLLLSNERYDDKLMDRLLNIEYDVRLRFPNQALSFEYLPKLYESADEIVNPASKQIYSRSLDVIFASPSLASTS